MNYVIVGSGPTGLSLAYVLSKNGKKVTVVEKANQLGGSWNMEFIEDKYFSENSPRILFHGGNSKKFLDEIGIKELNYVYGNPLYTSFIIAQFFNKHFSLKDYFIFICGILKYKFFFENITLQQWIERQNLSKAAKNAIKIFCITIIDNPRNTNVYDFFGAFNLETILTEIKQMKYPNKWHETIESDRSITFLKKCTAVSLTEECNKITSITCVKDDHTFKLHADKFFLCTQSSGLLPLLHNSHIAVKTNWMPYKDMKLWCENTFYVSFGFQLHFDAHFDLPDTWCWSCMGEWTVISLNVNKYAENYTKDNNVLLTLSCCIVDTDTKSTCLNKSVNECSSKDVVISEALRQMKIDESKVYKITTSRNLRRVNNKWVSYNTGFTRNTYGLLNMKGKIDNLYALGCFTNTNKPVIANFNVAIDATVSYLQTFEPNLKSFHNKKSNLCTLLILTIVFIVVIYLQRLNIV